MKMTRRRIEPLLNLITVLALVLASGLLVRDRILPAIRESRIVDPGESIPDGLRLLDLATGDTVELADLAPVTSLALLTACPSCERSAPAWRRALEAPGKDASRFIAIAIREDPGTRDWLLRELPGTRAFQPVDTDRFLNLLRIEVVPTVLTIGDDRRLEHRREGVLTPDEAASLLREGPARARGTAE
jgi:hypothetical protein